MLWYKISIFFQMMAIGFTSLIPLYWREVAHISDPTIGVLTAIGVAIAIAAPIYFGKLGNRSAPHKPIWISFFVCTVASPAFLFSPSPIAQGICNSIYRFTIWGFFTLVPVGVLHLMHRDVGREYGQYRRLGSLGFLFGVISAGWLTDQFGLHVIFLLASASFFLAGFPFLRTIRIEASEKKEASYLGLYKNRFILLFACGVTFISTGFPFYFVFLPLRMAEMGASNTLVSVALAMCGLTALFSLPLVGKFVDRHDAPHLLRYLALFCCARIAALYLPMTNPEWFILIQLLHIPTWVLFDVLVIKLLKDFCLPEEFSPAQALIHIHNSLGIALGSAIAASVVQNYSLQDMFLLCSGIPLIALIPFLLLNPERSYVPSSSCR
jgi:predicted MFS family arabinose efflux permease